MRQKLFHEPTYSLVNDVKSWLQHDSDIKAGRVIPTTEDRMRGHSCFQDSALLDVRQLAVMEKARDMVPVEALAAIQRVHDFPIAANCWQAYLECCGSGEVSLDFLYHAAIRGHAEAQSELLEKAMSRRRPHDQVGQGYLIALCTGLLILNRSFSADNNMREEDLEDARLQGFGKLRAMGLFAEQHKRALEFLDVGDDAPRDGVTVKVAGLEAALAGLQVAIGEDRAEYADLIPELADSIPDFDKPKPAAPTAAVIPGVLLLRPDGKHRSEVLAEVKPIAGKQLPLVGADKLGHARDVLRESHPHCHELIDQILNAQVGRPAPHFRYLFTGDAGGGKTSLATGLADALGMGSMVYPAGGSADGSFGGTSIQFISGRPSNPLQLCARTGQANPMVVVDEAEKVGTGRQNGNLSDVLLNFIEPSTARRFHDPALETAVDLSHVNWILCANSLEGIPAPLRDRLTIVTVPTPGWQHIGQLSKRIIAEIGEKNGLDPRWNPPLDPDELDVIRRAWPGGSLRQLTSILTTFVLNRPRAMGMH